MKIRFFSAIEEGKSEKDSHFKGRSIDLDILKPWRVSMISEGKFIYVSLSCQDDKLNCEYKFSDYDAAALLFVKVNYYLQQNNNQVPREIEAAAIGLYMPWT